MNVTTTPRRKINRSVISRRVTETDVTLILRMDDGDEAELDLHLLNNRQLRRMSMLIDEARSRNDARINAMLTAENRATD